MAMTLMEQVLRLGILTVKEMLIQLVSNLVYPFIIYINPSSSGNTPAITTKQFVNVFADVFTNDDDLIWPLQLIDLKDKEQFKVLYPLLFKLPHTVMHYLNELVFPEVEEILSDTCIDM